MAGACRAARQSATNGAVFSTDLRTADDVKCFETHKEHYCPSCGKSKGIYEKKKRQAMRKYNRPA